MKKENVKNHTSEKMDQLAQDISNMATSTTEEFYNKMNAIRQKAEKERSEIIGTTKRGMELDEFLAKVNSVVNALSPLYKGVSK